METDLKDQIRDLIERGAHPVSFREITGRRTAAAPAIRRASRRRVAFAGAGVGLAAAGCAAGLVIVSASPGAPASAGAGAPQARPSHGATFVTAAMIKHVASASRSALANSGQERISYLSVKNGAMTSSGTDTVTYSGSDWNYAIHTTVPAFPDSIARVVNGRYYIKLDAAASGQPWLHELGESTSPHFPESATLLRLLSPAAKFLDAGTDVIGGVRLTHLRATQVSGLPDDPTLAR
jgi:hypothetical protein